jgi:hypothetical protein
MHAQVLACLAACGHTPSASWLRTCAMAVEHSGRLIAPPELLRATVILDRMGQPPAAGLLALLYAPDCGQAGLRDCDPAVLAQLMWCLQASAARVAAAAMDTGSCMTAYWMLCYALHVCLVPHPNQSSLNSVLPPILLQAVSTLPSDEWLVEYIGAAQGALPHFTRPQLECVIAGLHAICTSRSQSVLAAATASGAEEELDHPHSSPSFDIFDGDEASGGLAAADSEDEARVAELARQFGVLRRGVVPDIGVGLPSGVPVARTHRQARARAKSLPASITAFTIVAREWVV